MDCLIESADASRNSPDSINNCVVGRSISLPRPASNLYNFEGLPESADSCTHG